MSSPIALNIPASTNVSTPQATLDHIDPSALANVIAEVAVEEFRNTARKREAQTPSLSNGNNAPALPIPFLAGLGKSDGKMNRDTLISGIGAEISRVKRQLQEVVANSIKAHADKIKSSLEESTQQIEQKVAKEAEAAEKAKTSNWLNLLTKVIGLVVAAVAVVVTAGAAAVLAGAVVVWSVMDLVTDIVSEVQVKETGKRFSLTSMIGTKIGELVATVEGLSPEEAEKKGQEIAGWLVMGTLLVLGLGSAVASFASSGGSILARLGSETFTKIARYINIGALAAGTATQVGNGVVKIQTADIQKELSELSSEEQKMTADRQREEQILERVNRFLELIQKMFSELQKQLTDILRGPAQAMDRMLESSVQARA